MNKKKIIILVSIILAVLLLGGILFWIISASSQEEQASNKADNVQEVVNENDETTDNETSDGETSGEDADANKETEEIGLLEGLTEIYTTEVEGGTEESDFESEVMEEGAEGYTESDSSVSNSALHSVLTSADTLHGDTNKVFTLAFPGETTIVQGGCKVGKYYYQAFIKSGNAGSIIVKYNMEKKAIEKTSAVLQLHHTNDITYNGKLGKLVVCHNAPDRTTISYVNPDTLTIEKTFHIEYKIFSISYNASRDQYIVGISGGQTFRILDSNFKAVGEAFQPTGRTTGYTTQGNAADDKYIYFVLYKENVITVYDWSGNFITLIDLDLLTNIEPENISVVDDVIYIGCSDFSKAIIYQVTVE